jgi:hypothetical protein
MSTSGTTPELRETLRKMRRLALAFHGSELRLLDRSERRTVVVQRDREQRPTREKVAAQA